MREHNRGFRLTSEQRDKLAQIAKALGTSVNEVVCRMIDNAKLEPVQRIEPTAILKIAGAER